MAGVRSRNHPDTPAPLGAASASETPAEVGRRAAVPSAAARRRSAHEILLRGVTPGGPNSDSWRGSRRPCGRTEARRGTARATTAERPVPPVGASASGLVKRRMGAMTIQQAPRRPEDVFHRRARVGRTDGATEPAVDAARRGALRRGTETEAKHRRCAAVAARHIAAQRRARRGEEAAGRHRRGFRDSADRSDEGSAAGMGATFVPTRPRDALHATGRCVAPRDDKTAPRKSDWLQG